MKAIAWFLAGVTIILVGLICVAAIATGGANEPRFAPVDLPQPTPTPEWSPR